MSCHLWNINKKFVSIFEMKINELEGQVPGETFKSYFGYFKSYRKKIKNNNTDIKKHIGRKDKTVL